MQNNAGLLSSYDKHLDINLIEVDWSPFRQVEVGEIATSTGSYYILNDHD